MFLVMEFAGGRSVAQFIGYWQHRKAHDFECGSSTTVVPETEAACLVLAPLLDALCCLHACGMVHRVCRRRTCCGSDGRMAGGSTLLANTHCTSGGNGNARGPHCFFVGQPLRPCPPTLFPSSHRRTSSRPTLCSRATAPSASLTSACRWTRPRAPNSPAARYVHELQLASVWSSNCGAGKPAV